jgi:hypothetical protein
MATAAEILKKQQQESGKKHALPAEWQHLKSLSPTHGGFQHGMTIKELSQLKMFGKRVSVSVDPVTLLDWVFAEWWKFSQDARFKKGLSHAPTCPEAGFLLKHCEIAVNLYLQSIAKPDKIITAPKTFVMPVKLVADADKPYKPTAEQIQALLAEL